MTTMTMPVSERIGALLVEMKLTTAAVEMARRLIDAGFDQALPVVADVLKEEQEARRHRRIERLLRASQIPPGKTFETWEDKHLPRKLVQRIHALSTGLFADDATNILAFGLPGTGKTHAVLSHDFQPGLSQVSLPVDWLGWGV